VSGKGALTPGCAHVEGVQVESPGTDAEGASKPSPTENGWKSHSDNGSLRVGISHEEKEKCSSGAREGGSESGFESSGARFSRSPGQKVCGCVDAVGSDCIYNSHEGCGERAEFIPIQGSVNKKLDSDSSSSLEDRSRLDSGNRHRASSSEDQMFQFFDTDCGSDPGSPDLQNVVDNIVEEPLKIRDLDSGKEFLMKRFNRDGSLNMLREVATGKDLTVAEFEKTLGLFSPVSQELHRRERFADGQVSSMKSLEPKTDGKAPLVTKRKSWLKRLKGALKTSSKDGLAKGGSARSVATYDSLDDTDASSVVGSLSGDGSPKRDSSFAGLDRNEFSKRGSVSGLSTDGIDTSFWRKPQKVKVKLRQKSSRDLSQLHLSQEILAHQGAIWTMKFSPDGRYLASAGQDRVVCVWEVVDHPLVADSGKPAAYIFSLRSEYRPYWFADRKSHRSGEQQSFVVKSTSSFIIYSRMLMLKSGS
jgi:WD40 repeat protein